MANSFLAYTKSSIRSLLRPPLHRPKVDLQFVLLGSSYGQWPLLMDTPQGALLFSFGLGDDITFDLQAILKFDCEVHGFDPTPRSKQWIASQSLPINFHYHPLGLSFENGTASFSAPRNARHTSYSLSSKVNQSLKTETIEAPVHSLLAVVQKLGGRIPEIVKMDIEGFEYGAIRSMIADSIRPRQLMIEFHHGMYGISSSQTRQAVTALQGAGYELYFVSGSGREYAFAYNPGTAR